MRKLISDLKERGKSEEAAEAEKVLAGLEEQVAELGKARANSNKLLHPRSR